MTDLLVDDGDCGSLEALHVALATRTNAMEYCVDVNGDEHELAQVLEVAVKNPNLETLRLRMRRCSSPISSPT